MSDTFGPGAFPPPQGDPFGGDMLPGATPARSAQPAPSRSRRGKRDRDKDPKPVTKRSLNIYKVGALVAVMVGLVAAIVIFAPGKKTYVVEASGNIPPLAQVTNSDLKAVPLPLGDIQSGAFTGTSSSSAITSALKSIGNQEAAYPIAQGQQLSASLFNSPQVQTTPIPPNYRLMSISAATSTSVGGTLRPGNVVDVISIESVDSKTYAVVVASGVQVVAVSTTSAAVPTSSTKNSNGTSSTNASASSSSTGVYVLKVPIPQVLNMTLGDSQGKIYLALQGPGANPLPQLPVSVQQQVCANSNSTVTVPGALTTSDCPLP